MRNTGFIQHCTSREKAKFWDFCTQHTEGNALENAEIPGVLKAV
jgi:hypothetical protein